MYVDQKEGGINDKQEVRETTNRGVRNLKPHGSRESETWRKDRSE